MEQLYYTSCRKGKSLDGFDGFRIRAASAGLAKNKSQLDQLVAHVGYSLPAGMSSATTSAEEAPVRFLFLNIGPGSYALVHSCYVGRDADGRSGNYFAHVLTDLPVEFDSLEAIRLWGSPFWRRADDESPAELAAVEGKPDAGTLSDGDLMRLLETEAGREQFAFVLNGFLGLQEGQHLYIGADSRLVALLVYALARSLPAPLRKDLTFSTLEMRPETARSRVVGATWANQADFPPMCYQGAGIAINIFTGRSSPDIQKHPYTQFLMDMVQALGAMFSPNLEAFVNFCAAGGIENRDQLELFERAYLCSGSDAPSEKDLEFVFGSEARAVGFLRHVPFQQFIIERAVERKGYASGDAASAPILMGRIGADLEALSDRLVAGVEEAIGAGDFSRAGILLEDTLAVANPRRANALRETLFDRMKDALAKPEEKLPWEKRRFLIETWSGHPDLWNSAERRPVWLNWLALPDVELAQLLEDESIARTRLKTLAAARYVLSNKTYLADPASGSPVKRALSQQPELVAGTYVRLAKEPAHREFALQFYQQSAADCTDALRVIAAIASEIAPFGVEELDALLKRSPPAIIPRLLINPPAPLAQILEASGTRVDLVASAVEAMDAHCLDDRTRREFLQAVAAWPNVNGLTRQSAGHWLTVFQFLDKPDFQPQALEKLTAAVSRLGGRKVFDEKHSILERKILSAVTRQEDLEEFILWLSGPLAPRQSSVVSYAPQGVRPIRAFYDHLAQLLANESPCRETAMARKAIVGIGVGGAKSERLAVQFATLTGQLALMDTLVALTCTHGEQLVREMDAYVGGLSREARENWRWVLVHAGRLKRPPGTFGGLLEKFGFESNTVTLAIIIGAVIVLGLALLWAMGVVHGRRSDKGKQGGAASAAATTQVPAKTASSPKDTK